MQQTTYASGVMQPPERPEYHKRHDEPPGTYPVTTIEAVERALGLLAPSARPR
jgi:hypothetical protein